MSLRAIPRNQAQNLYRDPVSGIRGEEFREIGWSLYVAAELRPGQLGDGVEQTGGRRYHRPMDSPPFIVCNRPL
jgi:hypothetical protein